jgi:thioredoxin 1
MSGREPRWFRVLTRDSNATSSDDEATIMAGSVMEFTDANWESEVVNSPIPVLVDFWAPWCGPCRSLAPTIEKLADDLKGKVKVGKLNTDENQDMPAKLRISAIPTVLVFRNGKEAAKLVGVSSEKQLMASLEESEVS